MWRPTAVFLALACTLPALADAPPGLSLRERNFLNEAAILNLTEIHAGKLAEDMAETAPVRDLARAFADAHATAHERLRAIAAKHNLTLPPDLDGPTQQQIAEMQTFTGPAFDRYFLAFQEETHTRALKLFEAQTGFVGDEGLNHYARTTLVMLNDHLRKVVEVTAATAREQTQTPPDALSPQSAEQPEHAQ
ncbi:MAG TPA: DUF4142 domain-containing protein [Azospirillum sp.]|nr:DUF4142 domain-containing protein [Azospirillum sp.]